VAAGHLLGHALCADGHYEEAAEVLTAALALAHDDRDRALLAITLSEDLFRFGRVEEAFDVARSAEAHIHDGDWRAELVGHRATLMMFRGELTAALEEVLPMLDGDADRPFVEAAIVAGAVLAADGRPVDAIEVSSRAYVVHQQIWEHDLFQSDPGVHLFMCVLGLVEAGRLEEAQQIAAAGFAATEAGSLGSEHAGFALELGIVATEQGRLRTALEWYQRAADLYATLGPPGRRRLAVPGVLLTAAQLGDESIAREALRELQSEREPVIEFARPAALVGEAWLLLAEGRSERALTLLDDAYDLGMARGSRSTSCAALHAMARMGRPERASERAEQLAPDLQGPLLAGRVAHIRAAAAGEGRDLERVGDEFAAMGADLYAAEAWGDAARAHRQSGRSRAADVAARRMAVLAADCEGVRTPGIRLAGELQPLTARELEIAGLAAGGLATPTIAERLELSPRTVSNHLQRAFEKLGVSRRDELAAALDDGSPSAQRPR
jgi:DNA-binding CsgD family transcriptional regulator